MKIKIIITCEQREERPDLDRRHHIIGEHDECNIFLLSIYIVSETGKNITYFNILL